MALTEKQKETLHLELGKMIGAGLPFDRALASLLDQKNKPDVTRWLQSIRDGLQSRKTISEALKETESTLGTTPLETTMIAAGERSGHLDEAFANLSSYFGLIHRTKKKIRSALIYPMILLHLVILLPAIPKAIASNEGMRPALIQAGIAILVLWAALVILWIAGSALVRMADRNTTADALLNRIPFFGKTRRYLAMSRFAAVNRMQLLAGLLVSSGLRAAGQASGSGRILAAAERGATRVEEGRNLSQALDGETALELDFRRGLTTAEEVGGLDEEMNRWALVYEERATTAAGAAAEWVPRIFYFIVAALIAWQVISMMLGYFKTINDMLEM